MTASIPLEKLEDLPIQSPMNHKSGSGELKLRSRISRILSEQIGQNYEEARKKVEHTFRNHNKGAVIVALKNLTTGRDALFSVNGGILHSIE